MTKKVGVVLLDADGNRLDSPQVTAEFQVPRDPRGGRRITVQMILKLRDVLFPTAGDYVFAIMINEQTQKEVSIRATLLARKEVSSDGNA